MGDLTWLSGLDSGKLLALAIGFILLGLLVPRWVLTRERQISDQWRKAYETEAENNERQTEILRQLVAAVEGRPLAGTGRHRRDG